MDKYLLLRRHSRPKALGKELAEEMADFLELFFVVFASGNMVFEKIATGSHSGCNIAALVIAILAYLVPQKYILEATRKNEDQSVINIKPYDSVRLQFPTEYDRENPITREDAMKEFLLEVYKISGPQKQEHVENLSSYFQFMPKQNQNRFAGLNNYAQSNPSFNQKGVQPPRPVVATRPSQPNNQSPKVNDVMNQSMQSQKSPMNQSQVRQPQVVPISQPQIRRPSNIQMAQQVQPGFNQPMMQSNFNSQRPSVFGGQPGFAPKGPLKNS